MKKLLLLLVSLALLNQYSLASSFLGSTLSAPELSESLKSEPYKWSGKELVSPKHLEVLKEVSLKYGVLKKDLKCSVPKPDALQKLGTECSSWSLDEDGDLELKLAKKVHETLLKGMKSYVKLMEKDLAPVLLHGHLKTLLKEKKS